MWQHVVVEQLELLRKTNGGNFDIEIKDNAVIASYGSMHGVEVFPENGGYKVVAWNHSPPYNGGTYELPEMAAVAAFAALRVVG
jgi:hypothetical protein